ncbi:hypothetical protein FH972_001761 [Carpinus fangiana]|uniref:Uncharacterized protein n=1 Tax=Carpinus fangiana TaxID=176857 RepID=A0A5N6QCS5_9ROSI|nr:hypothetical protein FH972_001761 [Carpinus fangiana]
MGNGGKKMMQPEGEGGGKRKGKLLGDGKAAVRMRKGGKKMMQPEGEGDGKGMEKIF